MINESTEVVSRFLGCEPENLFWTSGATESNHWAIHSALSFALKESCPLRIIISELEHDSIQAKAFSCGAQVDLCPVTPQGIIDLAELESLLSQPSKGITLFCLTAANNETGVIQPLKEASSACRAVEALFHVDAAQALAKINVPVQQLDATSFSFSSHKIGAPKGVGFTLVKKSSFLSPLIPGIQQAAKRGGTENPSSIAATAFALNADRQGTRLFPSALEAWHRDFENQLKNKVPSVIVYGETAKRLPNTSCLGFKGIKATDLLMHLDLQEIYVSAGSACSSSSGKPSRALMAMGATQEDASSAVRFSSGHSTKSRDFERVLEILPDIVQKLRMEKSA